MRASTARAFRYYGRPLNSVTSFKYLGWIIMESDDNWLVVVGNLWKARKGWLRLPRILVREGVKPRASGIFFKAVVQAVLIFRSEMWVMTPHMGRSLGGFKHSVSRRINGRQPQRMMEGSWSCSKF